MQSTARRLSWKTLAAFAIIYFVWGSTFLAIRIGVREVPPFLFAAIRFGIAGIALYGWMVARGERGPTLRQWGSAFLLALLIFVCNYGLLFWAEKRVASGVAAVIRATIPLFIALAEIVALRTQRLTPRLATGLLIGIVGVAVLMIRSLDLGGVPVETAGAVAIMFGAMCWSVASVLTRRMTLPESKVMSAGAQMMAGGLMLAILSAALGEMRGFHPLAVSRAAWMSMVFLIVAGSVLGFTAYVWLIGHESPTKVGTYAYVNPVVAVVLGYFLGGEALGLRTILGTVFVLISVVVITTAKKVVASR